MTESPAPSAVAAPLPSGVLWDMDGTLVDTEPYWQQSQIELVAEYGGTWSRADGDSLIGSGLWHSARVIQEHGVDLPEQAIIDRMTDDVMRHVGDDIPWRPGARELLAVLKEAGIPTALVTMSFRRMAEFMVDAIDFPAFDAIVSGDEVEHAKPHPEPYLRGAEFLGLEAGACVAIEDSPTGLASAMAAGAVALGVEHHAPLSHDGSYQIRDTLVGLGLDDFREIFRVGSEMKTLPVGDAQ